MSASLRAHDDAPNNSLLQTVIRVTGLAGLGLVAVIVALADVISRAPAGVSTNVIAQSPDTRFAFGTDAIGRDVFSETLHALSLTFAHALVGAAVTLIVGAVFGFAAVRAPLRVGSLLRGIIGIVGSVPALLLAVAAAAMAGHDYAVLAAGFAAAPSAFNRSYDRAMRMASSRHAEFARATGIPASTLLHRDLVYEVRGNFLNVAARSLASVAIVLSTMSFLGFGATEAHRDLGLVLADARGEYLTLWWTALFPALALTLLVLFARFAAMLDEGEPP